MSYCLKDYICVFTNAFVATQDHLILTSKGNQSVKT